MPAQELLCLLKVDRCIEYLVWLRPELLPRVSFCYPGVLNLRFWFSLALIGGFIFWFPLVLLFLALCVIAGCCIFWISSSIRLLSSDGGIAWTVEGISLWLIAGGNLGSVRIFVYCCCYLASICRYEGLSRSSSVGSWESVRSAAPTCKLP